MTGTTSSHLKTVREAAEVRGVLTSNKFHNGTSQGSLLRKNARYPSGPRVTMGR